MPLSSSPHRAGRLCALRGQALLIVALATPAVSAHTQSADRTPADSAPRVRVAGFVDAYYAWDVGRPPARDRAFASGTLFGTQPARHNEFNVNLAFVDLTLDAPRHRGRVALQYGTSVQANYAGEPRLGQVSGPDVQQFLQEAFAGVRLGRRVWVDGGIFFSNMGMESWISRDNPTYTRSLVADYSPYYSTGARLILEPTPTLTARLDVVNGWQTISENNDGKGLGVRLDWTPAGSHTLSYYGFASEEAGTRTRLFNGIGATVTRGALTLLGQADLGAQRRASDDAGWSAWYGLLAIARVQVAPAVAFAARIERYDDPDQVVLATGATSGATGHANPAFRGNGASLGLDVEAAPGALWRTEVRGFANRAALFPDGSAEVPRRVGGFVVTSLAVSF